MTATFPTLELPRLDLVLPAQATRALVSEMRVLAQSLGPTVFGALAFAIFLDEFLRNMPANVRGAEQCLLEAHHFLSAPTPSNDLQQAVIAAVSEHGRGIQGLDYAFVAPDGETVYLFGKTYTMSLAEKVDALLDAVQRDIEQRWPNVFVGGTLYEREPAGLVAWRRVDLG